jgi:hypothetical protein
LRFHIYGGNCNLLYLYFFPNRDFIYFELISSSSSLLLIDISSYLQIRRAELWNDNIIFIIYLSSLPRKYIRIIADFSIENTFFLVRNAVEFPEILKNLIFPKIDFDLKKIRNKIYKKNRYIELFLRLMRYLKIVLF